MIEIRTTTDINELMRWREEVIINVFGIKAKPDMLNANLQYYRQHVPAGTHLALIATVDNHEAGCGAICLSHELPSPDNPSGRCAYIMNIYVREQFRNHGVAKRIVKELVHTARQLNCGKIYLESTDMARHLYHKCGFSDMHNMMKL